MDFDQWDLVTIFQDLLQLSEEQKENSFLYKHFNQNNWHIWQIVGSSRKTP